VKIIDLSFRQSEVWALRLRSGQAPKRNPNRLRFLTSPACPAGLESFALESSPTWPSPPFAGRELFLDSFESLTFFWICPPPSGEPAPNSLRGAGGGQSGKMVFF